MSEIVFAMKSQEGLALLGTPLQQTAFSAYVAVMSVIDANWIFHTAAYHHSIADETTGLACSGLGYIMTGLFEKILTPDCNLYLH